MSIETFGTQLILSVSKVILYKYTINHVYMAIGNPPAIDSYDFPSNKNLHKNRACPVKTFTLYSYDLINVPSYKPPI